jgi:uncharacterized membrane protein YqiK
VAFRDDHDAALARADALERENAALREQIRKLESKPGTPPPARRTPDGFVRVAPAVGAVALATAIGVFATLHGNRALVTSIAAVGIAIIVALLVVASLFVIPQRDELVVLSGRTRIVDGRTLGYRILERPGIRVPMLERIDRVDLRPFEVTIAVDGAFTQGGIPVNVRGSAMTRVRREEIHNAIERFLGRPVADLARVTGEVLEGHTRGVLATLTPADVQFDLARFGRLLADGVKSELAKLGLELDGATPADGLKIESIRMA